MATGSELAAAYVTLQVKMPGVQKDIYKTVSGTDMPGLGKQMGGQLADGMKTALKVSAAAIGTVIAAGIGTALVKGFARLNAIDQATAKLKGLGNSAADVDKIMANALASVKGTSFGLGDAATVAAQAVAAGIKPGAELERVLKSVSNSAAAAGTGMGDMGSIYAKVASLGKAQNDSLQQVADRGIPIYQALAEQMGVSTDEVFKLASAGKIGFAEFETAMTTAAGTVAFEMGNTVSGSWSNFLASLGRSGAGVLGGVWSSLAPVLQAATNAMGPLEEVAASVGVKIGEFLAPAIAWLIDMLNNGVDFSMFSPLGLLFETLAPVLPVVSKALGEVAAVIGGALASVLPALLPPLLQLVDIFAGVLVDILPVVAPLIQVLADAVVSLLEPILPLVAVLVGALAPILKALSPLVELLAQVLTPIIQLIVDLLTPVSGFLAEALTWIVGIITTAVTGAIPWLGEAFTNVWNVIKPVVDWFGRAFTWLWETILQPIFNVIKIAFAIVGGIIAGIYETFIKPAIDGWAAIFTWLWNTVLKPIFDAIGAIFNWLYANVIQPIINGIKLYIQGLGIVFSWLYNNAIKPAMDAIGVVFSWLFNTVVKPVWDGISGAIKTAWGVIQGVIDTLVRVIKSDPKLAFEAARDAIGKAWDGIKDMAKKPVVFVIDHVINGLIDTINGIPGVNIPKVKLPKGFSDGGYTGNLAANAVAGVVHGNEHVIKAPSRKAIEARHPGLLDHMNQFGNIPGYKKGGMVHPMPGAGVTTEFMGYPGHTGIDLAKPQGTAIQAAAAGVVTDAGWKGMGGNMVYIDHGAGLSTRYAHMLSNIAVKVGQSVKAGQRVGSEGSTGNSTGPHLHYEVLENGRFVNPRSYLDGAGSINPLSGIIDGLLDWATGKFKGAFPDGGMFIDAAGGLMKQGVSDVSKWAMDMLSIGGTTPTLYDNGGWLDPGTHLVQNKSGRPEPILTGSQWDAMKHGGNGDDRPVEMNWRVEVGPETDPVIFARRSAATMQTALAGMVTR